MNLYFAGFFWISKPPVTWDLGWFLGQQVTESRIPDPFDHPGPLWKNSAVQMVLWSLTVVRLKKRSLRWMPRTWRAWRNYRRFLYTKHRDHEQWPFFLGGIRSKLMRFFFLCKIWGFPKNPISPRRGHFEDPQNTPEKQIQSPRFLRVGHISCSRNNAHLSNEKPRLFRFCFGDYTTQLYGDYNRI